MAKRRSGEPRVERVAVALVEFLNRLDARLARVKPGMNRHLQEAGASVLANVGEALDEASPAEKRRFFGYALRSAGECQRLLRGAEEVGAITAAEYAAGIRLIRDVKMDLLRLMGWAARETRRKTRR